MRNLISFMHLAPKLFKASKCIFFNLKHLFSRQWLNILAGIQDDTYPELNCMLHRHFAIYRQKVKGLVGLNRTYLVQLF